METTWEKRRKNASFVYIGIDNGLKGAVVAIDQDASVLGYWDTPKISLETKKAGGKKSVKGQFAVKEMYSILQTIMENSAQAMFKVILEKAHAMPKQGLSSTFSTGYGAGLWEGMVASLGVSYDVVAAPTWVKHVLKDMPRGDPKKRSMLKCQRIFPEIKLTSGKGKVLSKDGRSDAALIAYYGWLVSRGMEDPKLLKRRPVRKKNHV